MAEKVDPQTIDALTLSNVKTIAEAGAFAMAQRFQDEVAHARRVNMMAEAHLGKVLSNFTSADPVEAVTTAKLFKSEAESGLSSLVSQLALGQLGSKVAQSTPPETGVVQLLAQLIALVTSSQQQAKGSETTPPVTVK
jgi:hypothetical protein